MLLVESVEVCADTVVGVLIAVLSILHDVFLVVIVVVFVTVFVNLVALVWFSLLFVCSGVDDRKVHLGAYAMWQVKRLLCSVKWR